MWIVSTLIFIFGTCARVAAQHPPRRLTVLRFANQLHKRVLLTQQGFSVVYASKPEFLVGLRGGVW